MILLLPPLPINCPFAHLLMAKWNGALYPLLGCTVQAAALYTLFTALAEFFYHWNIHTPRWVGFLFQRPEAHRVHHQHGFHRQNYADLPVWDMLFGTFDNPRRFEATCGFDDWREDRFEDMLAFRNVHADGSGERPPMTFLPVCIGCRKRWACAATAVEPGTARPEPPERVGPERSGPER
jgi:hypothetical protein